MRVFQLKKVWLALFVVVMALLLSLQTAIAANDVTVSIVNLSNKNVCSVYISPVTDDVWTGEQLGNSQMQHWAKRTFNVPMGTYDLRADFCDGSPRTTVFNVAINANYTWEIGKDVPVTNQPSAPADPAPADPTSAEPAQPAPTQQQPPTSNTSLNDLFSFYEPDIYQFWLRDAAERGETHVRPQVTYSWRADVAAFYDPSNHSIEQSRIFSAQIKNKFGDYSVVTVLAHEWGHAIQADYGYFDSFRFTIYSEAQADCLTGAYTQDAERRGLIGPADVQAGRDVMFFVGDDLPWWDIRAHGSGDARVDSFNSGYWGGANACFQ